MQLTSKEERLILRRRKTWHKVLRRVWYVLSGLVIFALIFFPTIVVLQAKKRMAYQNSVEAIQEVKRAGGGYTFIIPANQYTRLNVEASSEEARLVADQVAVFLAKCDSLGLGYDKRVGMQLDVAVVPCGLFGRRLCASRLKLYSSFCGCDTDSLLDETVLRLDSTGTNADVISSQKVALASIQP